MKRPFHHWLASVAIAAGLGSLCATAPIPASPRNTLAAAEITATTPPEKPAPAAHGAEESFNEAYGAAESAALASADSADNLALAKTLFADALQSPDNPALANLMRSRALTLLFRSHDKTALDLVLSLEKSTLAADHADDLTAAESLVDDLTQGLAEVLPGDRPAIQLHLVSLYKTLAALQVKAHQADRALQSLAHAATAADAIGGTPAAQDIAALQAALQPLCPNAATLAKDLVELRKSPDDQSLNTEAAVVLLCDYGAVDAAGPMTAKADPLRVQGLADMAKYEAANCSVTGLDKLAIRKLAEAYLQWAHDTRDTPLAHLVLTQRAAELYRVLAASAKAGNESAVAKQAEQLATEAIAYQKDVAPLLALLTAPTHLAPEAPPADSTIATTTPADPATLGSGVASVNSKTRAEVQKIIDTVGPTEPDWMAATELDYPNDLDLTWQLPNHGGHVSQFNYLGTYIWSVINENPSKWKSGIKLMYKVLDANKDNPAKLLMTRQTLGRMYFNYLKDYARAAYFYQQAANADHFNPGQSTDNIALAHCYFALGNTDMAKQILAAYATDNTPHGAIINAWGVFGDVPQALKMADAAIDAGRSFIGYPAGGDVCRRAGRYDEALKYYKGFLDLKTMPANAKGRVRESYDTIKYFDQFDLSQVADGTYKGSAVGYRGAVQSSVTVKDHKIVDIQVKHREDQCYSSITDIPARIIAKQTVQGIDGCSGATVTSNAIIMGAAKAIGNAPKP